MKECAIFYISIMPACMLPKLFQSCPTLGTPWTVARESPLFMRMPLFMTFFRQEYESGWPFPPPGAHPDPRIKPESPKALAFQKDPLPLAPPGKPINYA